nr:protein translocase subunit SecD [Thermoanaerobaculia bacterium]
MSNNLLWRGILCLALAALAIFMVVPPREKINLGLDLQGGMHLTLRVKTADALRAETEKDMEALRRAAENEGLTGLTLKRTDDIHFELSGVPAGRESVIDKVKGDLFGGSIGQSARWESSRSSGTYTFTMSDRNQTDIRELAVNQALNTIRNRVDAFGVSEPLIARQGPGSERIVVQLPGVADPDRVRNLIKNTAFLEFRLVDAGSGNQAARSQEELAARYGGTIPETVEVLPQDLRNQEGQTSGQIFWALERRQIITGRDLRTAHPSQDQFGQPVVAFSLTPDGARQFGKATGENVGRLLAIVLDNKVQSAPSIHERITDNGQISGGFSAQEVQDLVTVLRSGALPAGIEYLEERTVGASLGADSVKKGLTSGLVATILVVLTMFVVYRLTGSNAVAAL